jgi:hypothetical protein
LRRAVGLVAAALLTVAWFSPTYAAATTAVFTGSVDASGVSYRTHPFAVESVGTIHAVLDWSVASANLNLLLIDPTGKTVTSAVSTNLRPETVTFTAQTLGTWKLGVKAKWGASNYTLNVSYPDARTGGLGAVDRASDAGIAQITRSYATYVHDVDGDGDQDFLYNRHSGSRMLLYLNDGDGNFVVSPDAVFPVNDRHDCVWADLNDDHRPDTYCAVGASKGRNIKANELWLQDENGVLSSVPGAWGAEDPAGRGREPALFDANGDGLLDLFVGNFFPRVDGLPTPNRFYLQDPAGTFDPAPEYGVDREIGGQCAEPADFDRDGWTDLMVCAHGDQAGLKLYRNADGSAFVDVAAQLGVMGKWCDAMWVDLNQDGRLDLTLQNASAFRVMLQTESGAFIQVYQRSMQRSGCKFGGGGNRVAAGDVDLDGYPDLYVLYSGYKSGTYNLPDVFLINDGTGTGFSTTPIPETSAGSGFSVAPIQADPDPEMEFLVTNGRADLTGPIQLIDFTPPST